jgi:hypothetical protein
MTNRSGRGALFLVGGPDRDQDDVEFFAELWRQHRGGDDPQAGLPRAPLAASAIRGSWLVHLPPEKGVGQQSTSRLHQNAKAQLIKALAAVADSRHRRFKR